MSEKTNRFTYSGTVFEVLPTKTFASGFRKRDFVCETRNGEYVDYAVFTGKKDLCDEIGELKRGQSVRVEFVLDGHSWKNADGEVRWFSSATAIKITAAEETDDQPQEPAEPPQETTADDVEDLPF